MQTIKSYLTKIPGWIYTLAVFGLLYLTGLHTEAIGQVQRVLLASDLIWPDITSADTTGLTPANPPETPVSLFESEFLLQDMEGRQFAFNSLKKKWFS